ncbi:MAG: hypothetical protein R3C10_24785 [Pirellulales bacterium]
MRVIDAPYTLVDAVSENKQNPGTYDTPSEETRRRLPPQTTAKLVFDLKDGDAERMWVIVDRREGDEYIGVLANQPITSGLLRPGTAITFRAEHVIAVGTERAPDGYRDELSHAAELSAACELSLQRVVVKIDDHHTRLDVVASIRPSQTIAEALQQLRKVGNFRLVSVAGRSGWFVFGTSESDEPELKFSQGLAVQRSSSDVYQFDFSKQAD